MKTERILGGMLFWLSAFIVSLCALGGCGGGGDAPAVTPPTCTPKVVTIGLWGDSTNYGETADAVGATPYRVENYPERVIQSAMDARFGAGAVVVSTHALVGSRLSQLLAGHQGTAYGTYADPWPAGATDDIEVENFGINDAHAGVQPSDFVAELGTMSAARPSCWRRRCRPTVATDWRRPYVMPRRPAARR